MASNRSGIGELPARLRPDHPCVDQPAFLQRLIARMATMVASTEKLAHFSGRASPERKPRTRDPLVQLSANLETVVAVVLIVVQQQCDFAPQRLPGCAPEAEPGGKSGGVAEREIEAGNDPLAALARSRQHVGEHSFGRMAGRGIAEGLSLRTAAADPDAVAPGLRLVGRTPVDDYEGVEQQAVLPFSSSCPALCRASTPSCRNLKDVDGRDKPGHDAIKERLTMIGIGMVRMEVIMVVMLIVRMRMMMIDLVDPGAAHVMMMALLRRADRVFEANDPRAVFA